MVAGCEIALMWAHILLINGRPSYYLDARCHRRRKGKKKGFPGEATPSTGEWLVHPVPPAEKEGGGNKKKKKRWEIPANSDPACAAPSASSPGDFGAVVRRARPKNRGEKEERKALDPSGPPGKGTSGARRTSPMNRRRTSSFREGGGGGKKKRKKKVRLARFALLARS